MPPNLLRVVALVAGAAGLIALTVAVERARRPPAQPAAPEPAPPAAPPPESDLDRAAVALIGVLGPPPPRGTHYEHQQRAEAALRALGFHATPQLLDAVQGDEGVAAVRCEALLRDLPADFVRDQIRMRWAGLGSEARWRLMPFAGTPDAPVTAALVRDGLDSKDVRVRGPAWAFVLAAPRSAAAAPAREYYLKALAGAEDPRLRWGLLTPDPVFDAAAEADVLASLLKPDSWAAKGEANPPTSCTPHPHSPDGRDRVVHVIAHRRLTQAAPALVELLGEQGPLRAHVLGQVLPLLGEFGNPVAVPELKRVLAAPGARVYGSTGGPHNTRTLAALALWQLRDPAGGPAVRDGLTAPDWDSADRTLVAEAVSRAGRREGYEVLAALLDDPTASVRWKACEGLERLSGVTTHRTRPEYATEGDAPAWKVWLKNKR